MPNFLDADLLFREKPLGALHVDEREVWCAEQVTSGTESEGHIDCVKLNEIKGKQVINPMDEITHTENRHHRPPPKHLTELTNLSTRENAHTYLAHIE
jgi:hypothetical protein